VDYKTAQYKWWSGPRGMSIPLPKNPHGLGHRCISMLKTMTMSKEFYINLKPQLLKFPTIFELLDINID
jgi:hypothetical protein